MGHGGNSALARGNGCGTLATNKQSPLSEPGQSKERALLYNIFNERLQQARAPVK
jgi:hypothetical protein